MYTPLIKEAPTRNNNKWWVVASLLTTLLLVGAVCVRQGISEEIAVGGKPSDTFKDEVNEPWAVNPSQMQVPWHHGLFAISNGEITFWGWNRETSNMDVLGLLKDGFAAPGIGPKREGRIVLTTGFHGDDDGRFYADAKDNAEYQMFMSLKRDKDYGTMKFIEEDKKTVDALQKILKYTVTYVTPTDIPASFGGKVDWNGKFLNDFVKSPQLAEHVIFGFCFGSIMSERKTQILAELDIDGTWENKNTPKEVQKYIMSAMRNAQQ